MINYVDSFPDREIMIQGQKYLYFGGTSYLGLQTDPQFQALFIDNVRKYGTSYGASRKSNIRLSIYDKAEEWLAELVGSEKCITMSSGYLAGQLLARHFSTSKYKLFYAPNSHSALHQVKPKDYTTFASLNIAVRSHLESEKNIKPVVLVDSVDFSGCNYPNFDGLRSLPLKDISLVVDDSHGIGILGKNGGGVFRTIQEFGAEKLIVCASLGKGLGTQAGAIFGAGKLIDQLSDSAFFGSASPASPAAIATLIDGNEIISLKRMKLLQNIDLFISNLRHLNSFRFMKDHPAFSFTNSNLIAHLQKKGIVTTNFRYPDGKDNLMSRIVLSANHFEDDINKLSGSLNQYPFKISENI